MRSRAKYRNRLEITCSMLEVSKGGKLKTHIMFGSGLSHRVLTGYLTDLEDSGLIRENDGMYTPTELGLELLEYGKAYSGLQKELVSVERRRTELKEEIQKKFGLNF